MAFTRRISLAGNSGYYLSVRNLALSHRSRQGRVAQPCSGETFAGYWPLMFPAGEKLATIYVSQYFEPWPATRPKPTFVVLFQTNAVKCPMGFGLASSSSAKM